MENEHSELIIGYLQGRLQGRSLDDFYAWVNESADNKKLFFETKALYEACAVMSVETGLKRMLLCGRTEPASVSEPGLLSLMIPVMVSPNVSCNWKEKPILK